MSITRTVLLASIVAFAAPAFAEEVKPGSGPTEKVGEAVPTMTGECAEKANGSEAADKRTEATKATSEAVPEMKMADCGDEKTKPEAKPKS